jgi:hypothetical protein
MKRRSINTDALPVWPAGKPIPSFRSHAEEDRFWASYAFEDDLREDGWEEIVGPRPAQPQSATARGIAVVAPHVLPLFGPSNPQVSCPSGAA